MTTAVLSNLRFVDSRSRKSVCLATGTAALATTIIFPLVGALVFSLVLVTSRVQRRWIPVAASVPWIAVFIQMNASKAVQGDWSWYTDHFDLLTEISLTEYLGHRIGPFTIRITEPIYYSVSYVVANLSAGNIDALSTVATLVIYVPIVIALSLLASQFSIARLGAWIATSVALLAGVTFTLTTHLLRQEIAVGLLVLALSLLGTGRPRLAFVVAAAAVCTHNSALVPVAAVTAALMLQRRTRLPRKQPSVFVLTALTFVSVGVLYAYRWAPDPAAYDGSVSPLVIVVDGLLIAALARLRRRSTGDAAATRFGSLIATSAVLLSFFLLGVATAPLALLRIYFYIETFRVLAIFLILGTLLRRQNSAPLLLPTLAGGFAYFQLRMWFTPFSYDRTLPEALFWTWLPVV